MSDKDSDRIDGGPAFPCMAPANIHPGSAPGMTLRDYFAGQALVGLLGSPFTDTDTNIAYANVAYILADAMLAERDK